MFPQRSDFLIHLHLHSRLRRIQSVVVKLSRTNAATLHFVAFRFSNDPTDPLSNLQFADDVLLVACSETDVCKMIADLSREAGRYGLKMHMGKTKVLTTSVVNRPLHIKCLYHIIQSGA